MFFRNLLSLEYWKFALLAVPGWLLGLSFHEFAHAWVADKMGDPTAKMMGRLTLNPFKHLDIIGTIAIIVFRFGWARPVPINPDNFRDRKKGTILVSLAGPSANLLLAVAFAALFRLVSLVPADPYNIVLYVLSILGLAVFYNLILTFFNLLPIPPLDGSQILFSLLPLRTVNFQLWFRRYGFIILILLMVLGVLGPVIILPSAVLTRVLAGPLALGIIP